MNTSEIKDKFYEITDNATQTQRREFDKVMRVMDTIGMNCAPSHFDEVLEREVNRTLKWVDAPAWTEWLNGILEAVKANENAAYDLRGYIRNTHTVG